MERVQFDPATAKRPPPRMRPPNRAPLAVFMLATYGLTWALMKVRAQARVRLSDAGLRRSTMLLVFTCARQLQYDESRWPDELARRAMANQEAASKKIHLTREEWDRVQALEPHRPFVSYKRPSEPILDPTRHQSE